MVIPGVTFIPESRVVEQGTNSIGQLAGWVLAGSQLCLILLICLLAGSNKNILNSGQPCSSR